MSVVSLYSLCISLTRSIVKAQFKAQRKYIHVYNIKIKVAPVTGYFPSHSFDFQTTVVYQKHTYPIHDAS
jgi:hypothetical protein